MIVPQSAAAAQNARAPAADTDRDSPPYLFMHSTGVPFLAGKNHHTLR